MGDGSEPVVDPYGALRVRDFRLFLIGNFAATLGMQMQTVAVGWEIYQRTRSELSLGFVGLVQFVPVILLALVAGHVADQLSRRHIVMAAMLLFGMASTGLAWISQQQADYRMMYACLCLSGIARAFQQPAKASLVPQLVPREHFTNAVTWNSGGFQVASVLGPAVSGLLIAWFKHATIVYLIDVAAALCFFGCLLLIRARPALSNRRAMSLPELAAGLRYLFQNKLILGAITLDMFAVLLGGATMLLPVYADSILHVGATGLGWMRAAPALGAISMAVMLAHFPPRRHAGRALLMSVVGFGIATIIFGLSRTPWLSLVMLFLTGALDNISVVVRHTLVQLQTPDELRGRVSAVNALFIGASNELGGFESGAVAELAGTFSPAEDFGPTFSVVSGGIGTLIVVTFVAVRWPQLGRYGQEPGVSERVH
jgi:MFS family permease